jgi:hypothetical protein
VAFAVAAAWTIAPALVAIGGATPMGVGGPGMVRACDPGRTTRESPHVTYELEPLAIQPVMRGPRHRGAIAYRRTAEEIASELNAAQVHLSVRLAPGYAPLPFTRDDEDFAGDAVDNGDDEAATELYRTAFASAAAPRRCAIAVGVLQAALTSAPWQGDDRVSAAVDGVGEALRAAPQSARATCRKMVMPLLAAWAARPFELARATRRPGLMAPAAERMRRLHFNPCPAPSDGVGTVRRPR